MINKKLLAPSFVALEALIHTYLTIYLIVNRASILAIGFIIFELSMFLYMLITKQVHSHSHGSCD